MHTYAIRLLVIILSLLTVFSVYGKNIHGYTIKHELKSSDNNYNVIRSIIIDSAGVIWVATNNGLIKYNGRSVKHYTFSYEDSTSLSSNQTHSLYIDNENRLFVSTDKGVCLYVPETDEFIRYPFYSANKTDQGSDQKVFNGFSEDAGKHLYVMPVSGELHKFNASHKRFEKTGVTVNENINCLHIDSFGSFWLGGNRELYRYIPATDSMQQFTRILNQFEHSGINHVVSFSGKIWISTQGAGIAVIDPINSKLVYRNTMPESRGYCFGFSILQDTILTLGTANGFCLFKPDFTYQLLFDVTERKDTPFGHVISYIYPDNKGDLWIGSEKGLLHAYKEKPFELIKPAMQENIESAWAILIDQQKMYLGTNIGIGIYNLVNKDYKLISGSSHPNNMKGAVFSVYKTHNGRFFIGSYNNYLQEFFPETNQFVFYRPEPGNPSSIVGNDIRDVKEDAQGNLWFACHGSGVSRYNPLTGTFTNYKADTEHAIADNWVYSIEIAGDIIWIGSSTGLTRLNKLTNQVRIYRPKANDSLSLSNEVVIDIHADHNGDIWLATRYGLNLYQPALDGFSHFTHKNGLAGDNVTAVISDLDNNIWISTNEGISKIYKNNQKKYAILNFTKKENSFDTHFLNRSKYIDDQGRIYFGTHNSIIRFTPADISKSHILPNLLFTNFYLFNQAVEIQRTVDKNNTGYLLPKHINYTEVINLTYKQNYIGFEFISPTYTNISDINYTYKLDGYDKQWQRSGNKNTANYTNLPPGKYRFIVHSFFEDPKKHKSRSVKVIIQPPWWETNLAKLLYFIILLSLVALFRHYIKISITRKKENELNEKKIRFFMNISHEFRTPLTLILESVEILLRKSHEPANDINYLSLIQRNSRRLLRLINQLLDLRRLDSGILSLKVSENNIHDFCEKIFESFRYMANRQKIQYNFTCNNTQQLIFFDTDILEKILYNLLANAFKYTPDGKTISLQLDYINQKTLIIKISDTGLGIEEDKLPHIFQRFYRIDASNIRRKSGTGIGLSLTKEMVELHKGKISVDSIYGAGTTFTIELPVNRAAYNDNEISTEPDAPTDDTEKYPHITVNYADNSPAVNPEQALSKKHDLTKETILVIDDNDDIRFLLHETLSKQYNIIEAVNGYDGYLAACNSIPDMIVSDVMMPKVDGVELSRKLKNDIKTSHIPLILLTAKSTTESMVEGLKAGADDYITKPFNSEILMLKINNLFENRNKLRKLFIESPLENEDKIATTPIDSDLILQIKKIIENNLSKESFGPDQLAIEMAMSRSLLYRKIKLLTGKTANDYIKTIKLNNAARIIKKHNYPISEVAFQYGYSNVKYFSTLFSKQFGVPPSQYGKNK